MFKFVLAAVAAAALLTSCGTAAPLSKSSISAPERERLAKRIDPRTVQATNAFGLELAGRIMQEYPGENLILSPVSIVQALSMTLNGASGPTREEMKKALHAEGMTLQELNAGQQVLREVLVRTGPGITLSMANSLWLQEEWPFRKTYLDRVKSAYGAELNQRDLTEPGVRKEMNKWVDKQTNGLIPTILDQPVSGNTRALLLNALYFDGAWQTPFEPEETRDGDFTNGDGSKSRISFMHREGMFEYEENDAYQAVRLPYGDGQMGMLVVLPRQGADQAALTAKWLRDPGLWTKRYTSFQGRLAMPKFRIEDQHELKKTLSAMGMSLPFDPDQADFSEMADTSGRNGKLFISQVVHKTLLDVSERGTKAAAATMVGVSSGSAGPKKSFEMTIDRPFLFAIEDLQSGTLLFAGRIEKL
ncbi:serpin family protein [Paenibacillus humicola]|uniref:serpin family protein n=1 Tax=Paenibacillus humicola TaxID=3110540 RepID=UPI00237BFF4B|nr:serpin family protein [Paenibacillus humicola]